MSILTKARAYWLASNYSGSGAWQDLSGNGHHAQLGDGVTASTFPTFQTNQPLGQNWLRLPGKVADDVHGPDDNGMSPTEGVFVKMRVFMDNWKPAATSALASKWGAAGFRCWSCQVVPTTGVLRFNILDSADTTFNYDSTVAPTVTNGAWLWAGYQFIGASQEVKFWTGGSGIIPSWTQLGTTVPTVPNNLKNAVRRIELGNRNGVFEWAGGISHFVVESLAGVELGRFDPNHGKLVEGGLSYVSSNFGRLWQIFRSTSGSVARIIDRPQFFCDGNDYFAIANAAGLNFAETEALTLVVAFRTYLPAQTSILMGKGSSLGLTPGYALYTEGSTVKGLVADTGVLVNDVGGAIPGDVTTYAAVVRNTVDDDVETFTNGKGSGSPTPDTTTLSLTNTNDLFIAKGVSANFYTGAIFGAALFREALTDEEISAVSSEIIAAQPSRLLMGVGG